VTACRQIVRNNVLLSDTRAIDASPTRIPGYGAIADCQATTSIVNTTPLGNGPNSVLPLTVPLLSIRAPRL